MTHKQKITILYVHANNTDIGGADYCLLKLVTQLDTNVFRPIVCLARNTKIVDLYHEQGIDIHIIDMERIQKSINPVYLIKLALKFFPTVWHLRKLIKNERVDIVHGNDLLDFYGPIAGRLSKKPALQHVRMIIDHPGWLRASLSVIIRFINDRVITVSEGVSRSMFSRNGHVMANVCTFYDWIDVEKVGHSRIAIDLRKEFAIPPQATLVGVVGRLEPWKGQDLFIKAASRVLKNHPDTHFIIVGGSVSGRGRETYGGRLKQLAAQLGVEDNIIFAGHRADISNVMMALDIFVHSSVSPEPFGLVVLEAQYFAKPVVGSDAGGVPEIVINGETGLLYEMGNDVEMAEKIMRLIENKDVAKKMGLTGRERVERMFDKDVLCKRFEDMYIKILKDSLRG